MMNTPSTTDQSTTTQHCNAEPVTDFPTSTRICLSCSGELDELAWTTCLVSLTRWFSGPTSGWTLQQVEYNSHWEGRKDNTPRQTTGARLCLWLQRADSDNNASSWHASSSRSSSWRLCEDHISTLAQQYTFDWEITPW